MTLVNYVFLKPKNNTQGFATFVHSYHLLHRICRFFIASCENSVRTHRHERTGDVPRFAGHDDVARRSPCAAAVRGSGTNGRCMARWPAVYGGKAGDVWGDGGRSMGRWWARRGENAGEEWGEGWRGVARSRRGIPRPWACRQSHMS